MGGCFFTRVRLLPSGAGVPAIPNPSRPNKAQRSTPMNSGPTEHNRQKRSEAFQVWPPGLLPEDVVPWSHREGLALPPRSLRHILTPCQENPAPTRLARLKHGCV